ncbi:CAP domain-containing protein [Cellulosimicrobium terreum]|nr:CAP domain-containing protein [Cellulosimicrobium terreum]
MTVGDGRGSGAGADGLGPFARPVVVPAVLIALLVGACSGPPGPEAQQERSGETSASPVPADPEEYAELVVAETNSVRATEGRAPLATDTCALGAASTRAADLVGSATLVHAPLDPVLTACDPPSATAAENLSRGAATPAEVVDAWLGSPAHRANLLDPALTSVGVACVLDDVDGEEEMLCSQVFLG